MAPLQESAVGQDVATEFLRQCALKYIWWKTADEALCAPRRVIAQVMNIGDYEDMQALVSVFGHDVLREALEKAEAGQFSAKSWAYWHYRLGLAELGNIPPLPVRKIP